MKNAIPSQVSAIIRRSMFFTSVKDSTIITAGTAYIKSNARNSIRSIKIKRGEDLSEECT